MDKYSTGSYEQFKARQRARKSQSQAGAVIGLIVAFVICIGCIWLISLGAKECESKGGTYVRDYVGLYTCVEPKDGP